MKNHLFSMIALLAVSLNAQNLIKDPEIDLHAAVQRIPPVRRTQAGNTFTICGGCDLESLP